MTRRRSRKSRRKQWRLRLALVAFLAAGLAAAVGWQEGRRRVRLDRLAGERDALRGELGALRARDAVAGSAPEGDLLVGVPDRTGAALLRHLTRGFLNRIEVELHDLRVRKSGPVRVRPLVGRMTAGRYAIDLRVHEVAGILEPGPPEVRYEAGRIGIELPIRLARGEGRATLVFHWDSKGVARAVCGDFTARIPVRGKLVPRSCPVKGRFDVELDGETLVVTPVFPDLALNLAIAPAGETWEAFDRVLGERGFQCRGALRAADVRGLVRGLLERGFDVRVPSAVVRPLRMPAAPQMQVTLGDALHDLRVAPRELRVAPRVVWYAADVSLRGGRPEARVSP